MGERIKKFRGKWRKHVAGMHDPGLSKWLKHYNVRNGKTMCCQTHEKMRLIAVWIHNG